MKDPRTKAGERRAPGYRQRNPRLDGGVIVWGAVALIALLAVILLSGCERAPQRATPDPLAAWVVNSQPYYFGDMEPVHTAYTYVAEWRGWSPAKIEEWRQFLVEDVVRLESGGCWMIFGGTLYNAFGDPCSTPSRVGRLSDAGFGQVTPVWYRGGNSPLCSREGLCSKSAVVHTAWDSMNAMLAVVDHSGSQPWCWNAWARSYHDCTLAPDR